MHLNDMLQVCLLAITSRYPHHTLDFNDGLLMLSEMDSRGWTAQEMIGFLESDIPHLLRTPAILLVDESNCEIFIPVYSEERPAIHIHCRGRIPEAHEHLVGKKGEGASAG